MGSLERAGDAVIASSMPEPALEDDRGEGPSSREEPVARVERDKQRSEQGDAPDHGREEDRSEAARAADDQSAEAAGTEQAQERPSAEPVDQQQAAQPNQAPARPAGDDDRPPSPSMPPADSDAAAAPPAAVAQTRPSKSSRTHLDLATFPTQELLKLLASLLQQIAQANDALRPDSSSMTADEATGVSAAAQTSAPRTPSSSSPARPASSSSGSGRRGYSAESLVIPPFKPKNAAPKAEPSSSSAASTSSTSTTVATRPTDKADDARTVASPVSSPPPPIIRQPSQAPQPPLQRSASTAPVTYPSIFTASRQSINHPSSILCFHARNIPSISIEAYLQRILKYCPITNEVFLSLLVYFDRMSRQHVGGAGAVGTSYAPSQLPAEERQRSGSIDGSNNKGFAIDSYNVHRLVIAGITVASKFFSDVFYTNSRYAKVGGLPQSELNQLELQFLLLNDFRLVIPLEEMQRYADQLLVYWETKRKGQEPRPDMARRQSVDAASQSARTEAGPR